MNNVPLRIVLLLVSLLVVGCQQSQFFDDTQAAFDDIDDGMDSVNVPDPDSIFVAQESPSWCWAACNQMLLASVDVEETQTRQAQKRQQLFGGSFYQGAGGTFSQAAPCLAGRYTTSDGKQIRVVPYTSYIAARNPSDPVVIIQSLKDGIPVVMATVRHGRVCVGVDYVKRGNYIQITRVRLLDPEHGPMNVPKLQTLSMDELVSEGLFGFMTIKVSE